MSPLVLIEIPHTQSIAIPCLIGYQSKKESDYSASEFWRSGLSRLYPQGELNLYPLEEKWVDEFKYRNDVAKYFYTHVIDKDHVALPAPTLSEVMQLGLISEHHLQREKKKSYQGLGQFTISTYRERVDTIQYAITRCQQSKDGQQNLSTS